jgi:hypothetical protein
MTQQIGSIISFEAVEENGETVLYGTARIEKASVDVCATIVEMFEESKLFFSFEILAAKVNKVEDLVYIGADPDNRLTAMCIVSIPAYKEAKAIRLVASLDEEMIKNVEGLTQWVAELEIDGVRSQIYTLLFYGSDPMFNWTWDLREFGVDYILLKNRDTGERKMIKYSVVDDKVNIIESYTVVLTRVEAEPIAAQEGEKKEKEETAAKCEDDEEKKKAEDASGTKVAEENPTGGEVAAEKTPDEPEQMSAEEKQMIEQMEKELTELRAFKAEAEKQMLADKKAALKATVEKAGLKAEDLSAEIENLDYEKVMTLIAEKIEPKAPAQVVTLVAEDGLHLKASKWADLVSDATGL